MSTIKNVEKVIIDMCNLFSDYDLSLICTSKCDDAYLECVSNCSSSDFLMECNRASNTCIEGKYAVNNNTAYYMPTVLLPLLPSNFITYKSVY